MRIFRPCISILFFIAVFQGLPTLASAQQLQGLPEDFPEIQLNVYDEPEPGYVFMTPSGLWGYFEGVTPYLAILDNYGTPVYYRELSNAAFDFKLQPNGELSFHGGGLGFVNHIVDSTYHIVDAISVSGYNGTDFHEFKILDNGNYLLLGWDHRVVDMDTVVPGGHPGVTVGGTLIQEKNTAGNILWEWSSWDHFEILECDTAHVDLTNPNFIDYVHTNAIEVDADGNILISNRNMHEVTKIEKGTGELIWRMGGSQNEFTFIGDDTDGFSGQHDIRRLENGNYMLFDNGWFHPEHVSSALEFQIDEINKTMTVVKRYRSQPNDIWGGIMGSAQRLPGGNTLVGWGSGVPNVTEFKPDGSKALEFEFESVSYRAFKFQWKTSIFTLSDEEIDFGEIYFEDLDYKTISLTNSLDEDIIITWMHQHNDKYSISTNLPLTISAGSTENITILFNPEEIGEYNDILTIYGERADQEIISAFAQQLVVSGSASLEASVGDLNANEIWVYPNPTDGTLKINRSSIDEAKIKLTNTHGQMVYSSVIPSGTHSWDIDISNEKSGIYILNIQEGTSTQTIIRKIIKK